MQYDDVLSVGWVECLSNLKTSKGKGRRQTTESYLRHDISCGLESCTQCTVHGVLHLTRPILMPDSETLSSFYEVLELSEVTNVIILSSVLACTKMSKAREAKIRAMMRDKRRRFVMFDDLHCYSTHPSSRALVPHEQVSQHLPPYCPSSVLEGSSQQVSELRQMLSSAAYLLMHWRSSLDDDQEPPPIVLLTFLAKPPVDAKEDEEDDTNVDALLALLELNEPSQAPRQKHPSTIAWPPTRGMIHILSTDALFSPQCWGKAHPDSAAIRLTESILISRNLGSSLSSYPNDSSEGLSHWSQAQVTSGLKSGTLFKGKLEVSRRSRREGIVVVSGSSRSLMDEEEELMEQGPDGGGGADGDQLGRMLRVSGLSAMNRAMNGDVVVVRLMDPRLMAADDQEKEEEGEEDAGDGGPGEESPIDVFGGDAEGGGEGEGDGRGGRQEVDRQGLSSLPLAQVVAVVAREQIDIVACLRREDEDTLSSQPGVRSHQVIALPLDPRLPLVRLRTRQAHLLIGQRFVLRVDAWERGSRWPAGHLVRVLGPLGDLKAESEAVMVKCGISSLPFCQGAMDELPQVASPSDWCIKEEERRVRRDLTDCMVCSIDPPSCTDVDDALHVKRLSNGQVEVGVHIADVSYFVREGGLLDAEAMDRCTSVYLVDRRIDMLPSLLSEHLCSLRAGVERFSVSVIWTLDEKDMRVSNVWMGRSLIRSRYQLTYQEAQDIFEGRPPPYMPPSDASSLTDSISFLFSLTRMLRGKRKEAGALLDLAGGELKFGLDPNTGRPIEVIKKEKLEAMDMIAEMMILANREVAEQIVRDNPGSALLRNHPPPTKSFEGVAPFLSDGASIDPSSNKTVSQALDQSIQKMRAQDNKAAESLVCSLVTQCMNEAQYLSSGSISAGSQRHYGLALEYYTHFTSPIRRYADVIVHRQLLKTCTTRHQELSLMAQKMNERHRQAKEASKVCNELFLLDLFVLKPHVVEALVVKILADRSLLEVFIPSYSMKGVVKLLDASGTVIPPLGHDRNKSLSIRTSSRSTEDIPQSIEIVANESAVIWSAEEWQTVLVELSAQSHRAHGPRLQIRVSLLDPQHQGFLLRHQTSPFTPPPPLKSEIINEPVVEDDVRYHSEGEEGWKVACVPMPLISGSGEDATDLNEARELRQVRARVEAKIDRTALGSKQRSELIAIKAKLDHLLLTLHMPLK